MADDGGLSSFQRRMNRIPKKVRENVKPALLKAGNQVADTAKQLAQTSRDSGALIDSIAVTGPGEQTPPYSQPGGSSIVPENAVAVTVGNTDVRYAHLVEYGTQQAPAQPFFWPAFRLTRKKTASAVKRAISKAIRDSKG